MIAKAIGFLANSNEEKERVGGACLVGLCFLKHGIENHPKIKEALDKCYKVTMKDPSFDNYSLGIALMFLCEVDAQAHRPLIEKYVEEMLTRQKGHGGWGYPERPSGDTSQTQYAVLGMWMAQKRAKVDIPIEKQEAVCGWLMRTQDVGGGWAYQGTDPGSLTRIQQQGVTSSLSAAGAGSTYMMADLLQVTQSGQANADKQKGLIKVDASTGKPAEIRGPLTSTLNPGDIKNTLGAADRWMDANFEMPVRMWNHYYMYALERYHSFREQATGVKSEKWYNEGSNYLQRTQQANGSWDGQDNATIATSFATLFLLRSTRKVLDKTLGEGVLVGGSGLPPNVTAIQVNKSGKLVDEGIVVPTEQILEILESENAEVNRRAEEREALILSSDATERNSQIEKLRKFVGSGKFETRMVAVTTLAKIRDLKNVPQLLYALTDPDVRIVLEADKALRFISRKVNGVGLPESEPTTAQIKAAQAAWKSWYLSIRPHAELLD